jgi:hypothetical protein
VALRRDDELPLDADEEVMATYYYIDLNVTRTN